MVPSPWHTITYKRATLQVSPNWSFIASSVRGWNALVLQALCSKILNLLFMKGVLVLSFLFPHFHDWLHYNQQARAGCNVPSLNLPLFDRYSRSSLRIRCSSTLFNVITVYLSSLLNSTDTWYFQFFSHLFIITFTIRSFVPYSGLYESRFCLIHSPESSFTRDIRISACIRTYIVKYDFSKVCFWNFLIFTIIYTYIYIFLTVNKI